MKTLLLLAFLLLAGCKAEYKDVSSLPEYKGLLNKSYALLGEMHISGVNLPPGYGEEINIYIIDPTSPSWSGPELITRDTLQKGTIITIQSIRECTNCFDDRVEAIVKVKPYLRHVDVPVTINLDYINSAGHVRKIK